MNITFESIGHVECPTIHMNDAPFQSIIANNVVGKLIIREKYSQGLQDLNGFSHIIVTFYFHESKEYTLLTKPKLDSIERGVFAVRTPNRPNPIGISILRVLDIKNNVIKVQGLDMISKTPILDIKPYIHVFDTRMESTNGWIGPFLEELEMN
jgi:tRNA-Thr(GGU) m(6)t(6)A37 methyltransferase TsaA